MNRHIAAALACLLLVLTPGAPSQAMNAATDYGNEAHAATNRQRANHDLPALAKSSCLKKMALKQAQRMADQGRLFHQDLGKIQQRCGMGWAGENIAYGQPTGAAVVNAWMNSPDHRANILRTQFRLMGIGAVKKNGAWWVAQVFGRKA